MEYGIVGLIVFILDIIAIIHIIQSGLSTGMKLIWVIVVLALPIVGMLLWFLIGEKRIKI